MRIAAPQAQPRSHSLVQPEKAQRPSTVAAPLLTSFIKRTETSSALQEIVNSYGPAFNHIHISAAAIRCISVAHDASEIDSRGRMESKTSNRDPRITSPTNSEASSTSPAHNGKPPTSPLLLQLLGMVPGHLEEFDIQGISNILYVLAKAGHYDQAMVESLLAAAQYRLDTGTPQNISNILWACASLHYLPDRDWLALFYDAIDARIKAFNPQDISNILWAFARLEAIGQRSEAYLDRTTAKGYRTDDPTMTDGVSTAATDIEADLQASSSNRWMYKVPAGIVTKLMSRSQYQLQAFSPQQLANTLWAIVKLGVVPDDDWTRMYSAAAVFRLRQGEFAPQEMASMVCSVSQLKGFSPPSDWTDAFLRASYTKVTRMSAGHLSQILLSVGSLRLRPPTPWLNAFITASTTKLRTFKPQEIANALVGIARLWSPHRPFPGDPPSPSPSATLPAGARTASEEPLMASNGLSSQSPHEKALAHSHSRQASGIQQQLPGLIDMDSFQGKWLEVIEDRLPGAVILVQNGRNPEGSRQPEGLNGSNDHNSIASSSTEVFNAQELSNVLFAVARLKLRPGPRWVTKMLESLSGSSEGIEADRHEVSNGMPATSLSSPPSTSAPPNHSAMMQRLADVPRQAAMVAWALRELGIKPSPTWISSFDSATEPKRLSAVGSMEMTSLLLAFASWRHHPSPRWMVRFWWQMGKRLRDNQVPAHHLVPMLAALCTLRIEVSPKWAQLCCKAMAVGMAAPMRPPRLIRPVKSGGSASSTPPSSLRLDVAGDEAQGGYDEDQMSSAARSLALLQVVPQRAWLRTYLLASFLCWEGFTPSHWVEITWALAKMKAKVPPEWLDRFSSTTETQLDHLDGRQLANLAWAMSRLCSSTSSTPGPTPGPDSSFYRPPLSWRAAFVSSTLPRLASMTDAQLVHILWHVNGLGAQPDTIWVREFIGTVRQRELSMEHRALLEKGIEKLLLRATGGTAVNRKENSSVGTLQGRDTSRSSSSHNGA